MSNLCPMPEPPLVATRLKRRMGSNLAVDGVDFQVRAGEVVALLGPNGAGKTTLMHLLAGLLRPEQGEVRVDGKADPTRPAVRARIGFAPQATAVYDDLTAEENLTFFGRLQGLAGARLRERVEHGLRFAGLVDRRRERASTFSGGMRRRLHVASAMVHEPSVLLLDEPTVGVDAASRGHLLDGVSALRDAGSAVVYASHHLDEVQRICDRAVVLSAGRVIADAKVEALQEQMDLELLLRGPTLRAGGEAA
jgi:ABC-2 type transport system ATP-binding protein